MLSVTTATSEDSYTIDGEKDTAAAQAQDTDFEPLAHALALGDPLAGISRAYQPQDWECTSAR